MHTRTHTHETTKNCSNKQTNKRVLNQTDRRIQYTQNLMQNVSRIILRQKAKTKNKNLFCGFAFEKEKHRLILALLSFLHSREFQTKIIRHNLPDISNHFTFIIRLHVSLCKSPATASRLRQIVSTSVSTNPRKLFHFTLSKQIFDLPMKCLRHF